MVVCEGGHGSPGGACLLVLPSDKPATRSEAAAVEALLLDMLRDPGGAAARWELVYGRGWVTAGGAVCGVDVS